MADKIWRILGVDPGIRHTGFGIIQKEGVRLVHVASGTVSPSSRMPLEERLQFIHVELVARIEQHHPHSVAVEDLFHAVNVRTALTLAHVRGAVLLAAASAGVPVASYAPREVKKTVSGTGAASKSQVAWMVQRLLDGANPAAGPDATDALAVAICHAHHLPAAAVLHELGDTGTGRRPTRPAVRL